MNDMDDPELDALLRVALAPPDRPADRSFVLRVDRAVTEAELYRRRRAALRRQLGTEALALGAVGGSLVVVAQVPAVGAAIAGASGPVWPLLLALLLFWMLVRGRVDLLA